VQFSDFEDPEARVIGGKPYRFGDNEEAAIRRWEKSDAPKRAELVVGYCAAGNRGSISPDSRDDTLGFRLAASKDVNR